MQANPGQSASAAASATAEELVADEDREAAKAAAKKVKKQNAKAKKQQARTEATAAAEPAGSIDADSSHTVYNCSPESNLVSPPPSDQHQQLTAALSDVSTSATTFDATVQHAADHQSGTSPLPAATTIMQSHDADTASHGTASGRPLHNLSTANAQGAPDADADFLQQLFCCPITKVPYPARDICLTLLCQTISPDLVMTQIVGIHQAMPICTHHLVPDTLYISKNKRKLRLCSAT